MSVDNSGCLLVGLKLTETNLTKEDIAFIKREEGYAWLDAKQIKVEIPDCFTYRNEYNGLKWEFGIPDNEAGDYGVVGFWFRSPTYSIIKEGITFEQMNMIKYWAEYFFLKVFEAMPKFYVFNNQW